MILSRTFGKKMRNTTNENKEKICRFDLDWHEDEYKLNSEGNCDDCGEYSYERVDCPRQFEDYGKKGIGPYFMCEECCAVDFSEGAGECLSHDCKNANEQFRNLNDKKSIFIDFLNELGIKNYSTKNGIFKFNINNLESTIISLDKGYEREENLSPSKENIELFDAYHYRKYCKAFELNKQWFGIENSYVEFLRGVGFLVNECDILHSSDKRTPIICFTSPMGIYGYTFSFFIQENSLNYVEIYPYNVESIFQKEYQIPYFYHFYPYLIFKDLEKALDKNTQYKLIRALTLTQNGAKLKINQKIKILHFLSTYFDFAFRELYNRTFNENVKNANISLSKLIENMKITSEVHSKEKLKKLKRELTKYDSESEFERKILSMIYLDILEIKGEKEDLSHLNQQFADLLISILIRNFFAHRSDSTLILDDLNYEYSKIALFSSILTMYHIFIKNDYSIINYTQDKPEEIFCIDENYEEVK